MGFADWNCVEALRPYLNEDERTGGTYVDLGQSAATPIGLRVNSEVELIEVEGRKIHFKIVCRDEREIISEGFHDRFMINYEKCMERLEKKS